MKIDFSQEIKAIDGSSIKPEPLTLAKAAVEALLASVPNENTSGEEKAKRFKTALAIVNGGLVDLSVDEVKRIKDQIGVVYAPLVVGRAWALLDDRTEEKEKAK